MSTFNAERAARILLDALLLGDKRAAEKWQVTDRTIENYRKRLETDPDFSALFARVKDKAEGNWRLVRLRFLRKSIARLEHLVSLANDPKHIADVAEAVRVIGELQIASDALDVDREPDQQDAGTAEDGADAPPGAQPPPAN